MRLFRSCASFWKNSLVGLFALGEFLRFSTEFKVFYLDVLARNGYTFVKMRFCS